MKKIINNRKYNTETASKIATWDNGACYSDFRVCTETLYRKKTGEYFLYGEGGPMTRYAEHCGDGSLGWGEEVVPLKDSEARSWAMEKLNVDEFETLFGEVEE